MFWGQGRLASRVLQNLCCMCFESLFVGLGSIQEGWDLPIVILKVSIHIWDVKGSHFTEAKPAVFIQFHTNNLWRRIYCSSSNWIIKNYKCIMSNWTQFYSKDIWILMYRPLGWCKTGYETSDWAKFTFFYMIGMCLHDLHMKSNCKPLRHFC